MAYALTVTARPGLAGLRSTPGEQCQPTYRKGSEQCLTRTSVSADSAPC